MEAPGNSQFAHVQRWQTRSSLCLWGSAAALEDSKWKLEGQHSHSPLALSLLQANGAPALHATKPLQLLPDRYPLLLVGADAGQGLSTKHLDVAINADQSLVSDIKVM